MKRSIGLLVVSGMLTGMLAACGAAPAPSTGGAAGGEAPAAGGDSKVIKVGLQVPLSGPQSSLGVGIRNGAELAVEQLSAKLTELGYTVELAPFDDQAKPEVGSANAKNIASDGDILCVVGHLNSGVALASLPDYKNAGVAMVSPANTNPNITEGGYEVAFRIVGRDDVQGAVGEAFARETLGIKSVYILHDTTAYGQGVAEFFRQNAEANGIEVLGFEGTEEKSDFSAILTPIQAAAPDMIYFGGIYDQAGPFFAQARERGVESIFMGPDGMESSELVKLGGDAVEGMYYSTIAAPVSEFPAAAQFATDYQAKYNEAAPAFSPQGYDSAGICLDGITKAAEAAGAKPTRAQVVEAIRNAGGYTGITGSYNFNAEGDPVPATYFVIKVNAADWNANAVEQRLEIDPPSE
jgi:ABC-type branched-subunit amino acid transport system substrate-binding protein